MTYLLSDNELKDILFRADKELKDCEKIKFQRLNKWRKEIIPDFPGVYALYERREEKYFLLYIGETGNLRERMSDICRTVNHTFRRQLACKHFNVPKAKGKLAKETENMLNKFFDENLYVSFIKVNFGRTEIESFLVTKYQKDLLNSETKRKLKMELYELAND